MSEVTGLGVLEVLVLDALERNGAVPDAAHQRSDRTLERLEREHGLGPRYAYDVLCDLARPWVVHLRLVDLHGNAGSPDLPPAHARYTEARLTDLGLLAVRAEHDLAPPLPIGLINGTMHQGGSRPPWEPSRLLAALRAAAQGADSRTIIDAAGVPCFPCGCEVETDLDAFARGERVQLQLTARFDTPKDDPVTIALHSFPPGYGAVSVAEQIASQRDRRIADLRDTSVPGRDSLQLRLRRADDRPRVARALRELWGVHVIERAQLPAPLPEMLRGWLDRGHLDDVERGLAALESCG